MSKLFVRADIDETDISTLAQKFSDDKIREDMISTLTENDLRNFGVRALGDRRMILLQIKKDILKTVAVASDPTTADILNS